MKLDLHGIHEDCGGMCVSFKMGQRSVHLEAASDIDECKISHKSAKIMDKAIKWLRNKKDKDGLGAMKVSRGKYHKYLVTSLEYSNKGECRVAMCDHLNTTGIYGLWSRSSV